MNSKVKIIISAILILTLAAGGFFLGQQFTEKVPLDKPVRVQRITLISQGVSVEQCKNMITKGIVSDRLVENLMTYC